ncbi:MAG: RNA methyltransferase [Bacteroidetes bacterium]|nr:RNA methyltransferase [Bacteroidota bacterium]
MLSKNQIKEIQSLHLKKQRDNQKLFFVEGVKSVVEVLTHKPQIVSKVYGNKEFISNNAQQLNKLTINIFEITDDELQKISLQNNPNQVFALCNYFNEENYIIDLKKDFTFYLDDIRDPGNFGTILRLADWYGIKTVFCSPSSCDFYNPKVIQSTMGAFMRVNVIYSELDKLLNKQKAESVYGAVLTGENIYKSKLTAGLIIIGNEANGISDENLKLVTRPLTIPSHQTNGTESLNAAMATAIIVSEFYRQLKIM